MALVIPLLLVLAAVLWRSRVPYRGWRRDARSIGSGLAIGLAFDLAVFWLATQA